MEIFGDIQTLAQESLVQDVAARIDIEVAQHDEVLAIGIDVTRPINEPPGDTENLIQTILGVLAINNVYRNKDKRLVS